MPRQGRPAAGPDGPPPAERLAREQKGMVSIDDENDQVKEGHLVDALACTGDEGRDTLR